MFLDIWNLEIGLHIFTMILQNLHLHGMSYFLVDIFLTKPPPGFYPGAVPDCIKRYLVGKVL